MGSVSVNQAHKRADLSACAHVHRPEESMAWSPPLLSVYSTEEAFLNESGSDSWLSKLQQAS